MPFKMSQFAAGATVWVGSTSAIYAAFGSLVVFLAGGLVLGFSDTYQLLANTFMSAVSYVMLFLIQHTQNHDTRAIQLKLDAIIHSIEKADNKFLAIEEMEEEQLAALHERFKKWAARQDSMASNSSKV